MQQLLLLLAHIYKEVAVWQTSTFVDRPGGRPPTRLGAASAALCDTSSSASALISAHAGSASGASARRSVVSGSTSHACAQPRRASVHTAT